MGSRKSLVRSPAKPPLRSRAPVVMGLKLPAPGDGDPNYALQKLDDCVRILVTHPGPLRLRLREALYPLAIVTARDLPESLRPEFEDIRRRTNKNPSRPQKVIRGGRLADVESGTIDATVPFMRTDALVGIAERLLDLSERLDALTGTHRPPPTTPAVKLP